MKGISMRELQHKSASSRYRRRPMPEPESRDVSQRSPTGMRPVLHTTTVAENGDEGEWNFFVLHQALRNGLFAPSCCVGIQPDISRQPRNPFPLQHDLLEEVCVCPVGKHPVVLEFTRGFAAALLLCWTSPRNRGNIPYTQHCSV